MIIQTCQGFEIQMSETFSRRHNRLPQAARQSKAQHNYKPHSTRVRSMGMHFLTLLILTFDLYVNPVDNFGTVVGENPTPYGILALWAVNELSIVYWEATTKMGKGGSGGPPPGKNSKLG